MTDISERLESSRAFPPLRLSRQSYSFETSPARHRGHSEADSFNLWVYVAWLLLARSILGAIIYCYASAKRVKLAWGQTADMFGIGVQAVHVEKVLDLSYFAMLGGL
jgi:hypothetical protein